MPIYTYRCPKCEHVFDVEKGMNDPHPKSCPECRHSEVKRRFYPPAMRYRGSGFFHTDKALYTPTPGYDGPDEDEMI